MNTISATRLAELVDGLIQAADFASKLFPRARCMVPACHSRMSSINGAAGIYLSLDKSLLVGGEGVNWFPLAADFASKSVSIRYLIAISL